MGQWTPAPVLIVALTLWTVCGLYAAIAESVIAFLVSGVSAAIAALSTGIDEFVRWKLAAPTLLDDTADHAVLPLSLDRDAIAHLAAVARSLRTLTGRVPTIEETADIAGVPLDEALRLIGRTDEIPDDEDVLPFKKPIRPDGA